MIDEWLARRPAAGERLQVGAKELAKLLGHLVFGSQVVPGGRKYMQAMLSSFAKSTCSPVTPPLVTARERALL